LSERPLIRRADFFMLVEVRSLVLVVAAACGDNISLAHFDAASGSATDSQATDSAAADAASDAMIDALHIDVGDQNEGATSGTRIKLVWYQTPDGVKSWIGTTPGPGFYDTLLGSDCHLSLWNDNNTYCTPTSMTALYSDASCSSVIGQWWPDSGCPSDVPLPAYVTELATGCGNALGHLYQRGAKLPASQAYYTRDSAGRCSGPFTNSSYALYATGPELPASALAQVTAGSPEGTGALQIRWWHTADGMRAMKHAYDPTLGECVPENVYSGPPVCAPLPSRSVVFSDSSCTTREVGISSACQVQPHTFALTNTSCPKQTATFWNTGAQVSPSALFWIDGSNKCSSTFVNPSNTYYSIGAQVMPPQVQYETDTIAGARLEPHHYTTTDFRFRDRVMHDTVLGGDCYLSPETADQAICLPNNVGTATPEARQTGIVDAYSDDACTQPITLVQVFVGIAGCEAITPPALVIRTTTDSSGCSQPELHHTGAPYTGGLYFKGPGFCYPSTYAPNNPQLAFYDGSTIIPNSSIARATRVVDP
jgi:hypothetical protein